MVNYYVMYEWGRNKRRTASEKEVGEVSVNLKALIGRQSYYQVIRGVEYQRDTDVTCQRE